MSITITLIIQGLALFLVAWLVMKLFWPGIMGAIEQRQKTIADGLAAANRGEHALEDANKQALDIIRDARSKAAQIVDQASRRGSEVIAEARGTALSEGERLLGAARTEISSETARARGALRAEVGKLALAGAARVLQREVDAKAHAKLLEDLSAQIAAG
jgi:F-type H+-transporting ATPase subunit b